MRVMDKGRAPGVQQAAKLMNDELAAVIASHPSRFRGVAILPVVDPDAMVAELRRAVTELGFVGAFVAVGPTISVLRLVVGRLAS
jgi:predicted TIM-barrel fold metal-dependent hydrolase